jgi:hypothetical protein
MTDFEGVPKKDIQLHVRSGKKILDWLKSTKIHSGDTKDRMNIFIHPPQCLAK